MFAWFHIIHPVQFKSNLSIINNVDLKLGAYRRQTAVVRSSTRKDYAFKRPTPLKSSNIGRCAPGYLIAEIFEMRDNELIKEFSDSGYSN